MRIAAVMAASHFASFDPFDPTSGSNRLRNGGWTACGAREAG
jgi:hypothetical protein